MRVAEIPPVLGCSENAGSGCGLWGADCGVRGADCGVIKKMKIKNHK